MSPVNRTSGPVVVGSLAAGFGAAAILTMVVFPGATEGVTAGAALLGFGLGWAMLRTLSRWTTHPQRWATVPAIAMTATGAALVLTAPSESTLSTLTWVWPPLALALAGWTYVQMRRSLAGLGRWAVTTALVLLAVAAAGAGVRNLTTDSFASTYPAPGVIRSVGDHDLHIDCRGQGQPTVVLVNGMGEFSASWARIRDGVAPTTRVCAYDRAGQGWSDDLPNPQDGIAAAADLHALLAAAGETGPFVLAGHSIGGPYAMTYAEQYPDEVAGMVLLDSTTPRQFDVIPAYPTQYAMMRRAYGVLPSLARMGLGVALAGSHLPSDDAAPVDAMSATPRAGRNARDELWMLPVVFEQARALTSLGDRPLVVLTSAENARDSDGWMEAQEELAGLSTNAVRRDAATSHAGIVEDADGAAASMEAIASVVRAVRTNGPVATP
ncbi:alpha/beta hydrolase [Nocardioides cavernae]|uniref:alpha/beta fold hydrolase n=1 Tax=Nocardioides TaxID=1839 RepID=UPI00138EFE29|nr:MULTISPECIES: alpha/beta hydrolase [Nocardioides]MCK9823260.1 alpha/beta hydrolase [Nocardioides cavernae]